ncbi:hypothetical protein HQQ81_11265 [Microbacteriaceae bacterium VKM Ac-2854]|nr:hypothetical protein [Microbacteriaceae bacterium VKM Ac-2854]
MKRHLVWILPLVIAAVLFFGGGTALSFLGRPDSPDDTVRLWVGLALLALTMLGPIVCIVVAIVRGIGLFRRSRAWRR